eukprot:TRINITY_DN11015_c0_g1_i2.p1 TRINITY_DN11015_c0_g1~~TRINITY_DN11015_c0_g1_i2.p1  ORF type:complete len:269 (-),score=62.45 TRINITY_DN11015_c0_g1_i2:22-828(-)
MVVFSPASYAAASGRPVRVLCFGDSWTHGNTYGLQRAFASSSDVVVTGKDYWGSTAQQFAENIDLLPDTVTKHNADYVVLSMGGNDFKNFYMKKREYVMPWTALKEVEANMRLVLEHLFQKNPHVRVVMYGYDFPGSVHGVLDYFLPAKSYSSSAARWAYDWLGVPIINRSCARLGAVMHQMANDFTQRGNHFTYVPLWGSLQAEAALTQGKKMAGPSMSEPSPTEYMADPIHANEKGYTVLMRNLYDRYFVKELGLETDQTKKNVTL